MTIKGYPWRSGALAGALLAGIELLTMAGFGGCSGIEQKVQQGVLAHHGVEAAAEHAGNGGTEDAYPVRKAEHDPEHDPVSYPESHSASYAEENVLAFLKDYYSAANDVMSGILTPAAAVVQFESYFTDETIENYKKDVAFGDREVRFDVDSISISYIIPTIDSRGNGCISVGFSVGGKYLPQGGAEGFQFDFARAFVAQASGGGYKRIHD